MTKAESDVNGLLLHYSKDKALGLVQAVIEAQVGNIEQSEHWSKVRSMIQGTSDWNERNAYVLRLVKGTWYYCSEECMAKDNPDFVDSKGHVRDSETISTGNKELQDEMRLYPKTPVKKCDCCGKKILTRLHASLA